MSSAPNQFATWGTKSASVSRRHRHPCCTPRRQGSLVGCPDNELRPIQLQWLPPSGLAHVEELREPINALIRWSTPLMIRGPEGDEFRPDGLLVALPALFSGRMPVDQSVAVGITVDGVMVNCAPLIAASMSTAPTGVSLTQC
jgi:hypothetical protein